jgi:hypothetical protein
MGCKKEKPKEKPKPGKYQCGRCGAAAKKEKDLCKPKKVKKDES